MFLLNLTEILKNFFNIKSDYIILIIYTLIIYIIYKLSIKVFAYITTKELFIQLINAIKPYYLYYFS